MVKAGDILQDVYWIRCFLHVLHCAIQKGMVEVDRRTHILEKCRSLVAYFGKSSMRKKHLFDVQQTMQAEYKARKA